MQKIQKNAELSIMKIVEDYLMKQNIHKNGSKHKNRNKKVLDNKYRFTPRPLGPPVFFLSGDEFLTKCLFNVPNPTKTSQKEIHKACDDYKMCMLKQYFFWNSVHEKPSFFKENQTRYLLPLTIPP